MTTSLMPQQEAATGEPSLFDSLSRLVPSELQREITASWLTPVLSIPSKLEPHRELIRELRRSGRTYREVARLFSDRLGFHVAPSTLHSFVKVRARHRKQVQFELPPLVQVVAGGAPSSRVAALKAKPPANETKRTRFVFRENEPLTLSSDGGAQ